MDIAALQTSLRTFAAERNWQPFHTPKNLTAALMVEAAELLEIFQWMTADESKAAHLYPAMKERIADEVADVFLYLLQVADRCAIDLTDAVANKLVKNASKHPVPDSASSHVVAPLPADHVAQPNDVVAQSAPDTVVATTSTAAQTHVLVDWENVQPKGQDIQRLVLVYFTPVDNGLQPHNKGLFFHQAKQIDLFNIRWRRAASLLHGNTRYSLQAVNTPCPWILVILV